MTIPPDQALSLDRLELIEIAVPQVESFRSAIGDRRERRALLVLWRDRDGAWGLGECSCRPDPFYSHEFNRAVVELVRDHLAPMLGSARSLEDVGNVLRRVRGWPFAKAAVLDAALDLLRRSGARDALDQREVRTSRVPAGISLGIFDQPEQAVDRVAEALRSGYRRIKMKVRPEMDLGPVQAVRAAFPDAPLAFDANGSCATGDLGGLLTGLVELDPLMIEQPFPGSRLDWCAAAKRELPEMRICLDESIEDLGDLETAVLLGACDELNIKPGRVGGQTTALALLDRCTEIGLPVWIGGMFETGIARFANLRMAARIDGASAHDLSPSRRYFTRDVVTSPLEMDPKGHIALADEGPPEVDWQAIGEMTIGCWKVAAG